MPPFSEPYQSKHLFIRGVVQGVGFRPFVYRMATELLLKGYVLNHDCGVEVRLEGPQASIDEFLSKLYSQKPTISRIDQCEINEVPFENYTDFQIRHSRHLLLTTGRFQNASFVPLSADLAICSDCRQEILDPMNRRYFYPFANCTNCGPRFTIIQDIPYDRSQTTLKKFKLCGECQKEYEDPLNRRFHAQPNACEKCGPQLLLYEHQAMAIIPPGQKNHPYLLNKTCESIKKGNIVALKGVGGYHLVCDARNEAAVKRLRDRKFRELKPFAVMVASMEQAENIAKISAEEKALLESIAAPIVLLEKKLEYDLAESVAPQNRLIGIMLPYSPLHLLLMELYQGPLVMTSGNCSEEPVVYEDQEAFKKLGSIADIFLTHNREIHVRCDDSVVRFVKGDFSFLRRSRGYVPLGHSFSGPLHEGILAVGAELKNTFAFSRQGEVILSHHIGDLENLSTLEAFEHGIEHFSKLFRLKPKFVVRDLHPDYLSSQWAEKNFTSPLNVQHHHAHIAACLEENHWTQEQGPVLGLALDGTGLGLEGEIWGGELLIADRKEFIRIGRFRPGLIPGGDQGIRYPWRTALGYLSQTSSYSLVEQLPQWDKIPTDSISVMKQMIAKKLNTFQTSSLGRLFDAMAAISGIVLESQYEGHAPTELERCLDENMMARQNEIYAFQYVNAEVDWRPVLEQAAKDAIQGVTKNLISCRFHNGLIAILVQMVCDAARKYDIQSVALSGGCFLNEALRLGISKSLYSKGIKVLTHHQYPAHDGGISLGQLVIANEILKESRSCVSQYR